MEAARTQRGAEQGKVEAIWHTVFSSSIIKYGRQLFMKLPCYYWRSPNTHYDSQPIEIMYTHNMNIYNYSVTHLL